MSKLVNFSTISFINSDNASDECRYQSINENIRLGYDEGTLEVDAIVKELSTGKLYKTTYYARMDDYNGGLCSYGKDSETDMGGDGWCKLIEVKGVEVKKIEYVENDDGKEVDEREDDEDDEYEDGDTVW